MADCVSQAVPLLVVLADGRRRADGCVGGLRK